MLMIKSADLHCLATAFLSDNIDETKNALTCKYCMEVCLGKQL